MSEANLNRVSIRAIWGPYPTHKPALGMRAKTKSDFALCSPSPQPSPIGSVFREWQGRRAAALPLIEERGLQSASFEPSQNCGKRTKVRAPSWLELVPKPLHRVFVANLVERIGRAELSRIAELHSARRWECPTLEPNISQRGRKSER